ncbi:hypothetical protein [Streptomyces sp. NPDC050738]|uniref:hypothetical protein n=1 Tax=Streptomyces sp. NPDC050738 TaxID=3154744 RepID=UPI003411FF84
MRRSPAAQLTIATTALAVMTLGACGTEKANTPAERSKPAVAAAAPAAVRASAQQDAGFTAMLAKIAQSCPPSAPPKGPPTGPRESDPPGSKETPPDDAFVPVAPTAGPEAELNARDWCASNLHEERIAQALWNLKDPTPAKVRTVLNGLGYVDERVHDLKQSGATTRFFLDLREKGGRLCLEGSAAGERTVIDKCVAPVTGPFSPVG